MRPIKFRFCDYQGCWHYWTIGQPAPDFDQGDITSLGQYTGLTDCNGVEIYEGDFVKDVEYPVTFEQGAFLVTTIYDMTQLFLHECDTSELEVIGNVFENPELMEQ